MNEDDKIAFKSIVMDFVNDDTETSLDIDTNGSVEPLIEYANVLHEIGFNTLSGGSLNLENSGGNKFDTNGWQVDFWWTIHREDKKFMIAGSLFYGKYKLTKEDDSNEDE